MSGGLSPLTQTMSALSQSQTAGSAAEAAANKSSQNARLAFAIGQANAQAEKLKGAVEHGKLMSQLAGTGANATTGTPLLMLAEDAKQHQLAVDKAAWEGALQAHNEYSKAGVAMAQAKAEQSAAKSNVSQSFIGAFMGNGGASPYAGAGGSSQSQSPSWLDGWL